MKWSRAKTKRAKAVLPALALFLLQLYERHSYKALRNGFLKITVNYTRDFVSFGKYAVLKNSSTVPLLACLFYYKNQSISMILELLVL